MTNIEKIKVFLQKNQGKSVHLYARGDRNKILDTIGILEGVYKDVFTVTVQEDAYVRRYCYTFKEIFTRHVYISPTESEVS